jgi:ascorbate-specific PTS system EIIC-type component UlaA
MFQERAMLIGVLLVIVGIVLLLERLDIIEGGFGTYWPLILVAVGAVLIFDRLRGRGR